jgi:CBS domain-containing protein
VTARDVARSLPVPLTILRRSEIERLLAMPITRVMSTPVIALSARATVEEAVNKMVEHSVGAVCVIDPEGGGLVGIITRSTIARLIAGSTRQGA